MQQGGQMGWVIYLAFFAILWAMMILPQRRQQKTREKMLGAMKKGDKVITAGGIHGEIIELGEEDLKLRIAEKVEIKITKAAISRVKGE
jgi:preprotein translocase subunit YajC